MNRPDSPAAMRRGAPAAARVPRGPRASLAFPLFPLSAAALLGCYAVLPIGRQNPVLRASFLGASAILLTWTAWLFLRTREEGRRLDISIVVRRPHYIQMLAQGSVLVYWGWWVRSVYAFSPFILAQILFAYGVDSLLNWTRRDTYRLGVGPIPVVFSISLFLWFKLEAFYWQFALVALVFLGKEFLRWTRDGASRHIFNPSSFALAVAAALLIAAVVLSLLTPLAAASIGIAMGAAGSDVAPPLYVLVTSDRGLCGAFNSNIVKTVIAHLEASATPAREVAFYTVGRKSAEQARRRNWNRLGTLAPIPEPPSAELVSRLDASESVMIVGHQPATGRLVYDLTGALPRVDQGTLAILEVAAVRQGGATLVGLYDPEDMMRFGR